MSLRLPLPAFIKWLFI